MESLFQIINAGNDWLNGLVWGPAMLALLVGTGVYTSFRLGFPQIFKFGFILKNTLGQMFTKSSDKEGDIPSAQAGLTSIAAVVGTGNIVGVATAITLGGPGAIFWMWVAAFFGMTTKFSEIALGIKYREKRPNGNFAGGPMYYITKGLGQKWAGIFFSIMVIITYFVIGAIVDTNSIALSVQEQWGVKPLITGIILAAFTAMVVLGGIKRIGEVCQFLTPFMGGIYILAGLAILVININEIPGALGLIVSHAFKPTSAAGGFLGSTIALTMRAGIARGLFSNEAGLGSSPIIHSSAQVDHPVEQSIWGVAEVFVDTILICTITGLAILISGEWTGGANGAALTMRAFDSVLPFGNYIVLFSMILFGYSCLISANYYCERAGDYLWGTKSIVPIRVLWVIFVVIGSLGGLEFVWALADTCNGLMAIPNLIAVILLTKHVVTLKKDFFTSK